MSRLTVSIFRFTRSTKSSGLAAFSMPMTSLSTPSCHSSSWIVRLMLTVIPMMSSQSKLISTEVLSLSFWSCRLLLLALTSDPTVITSKANDSTESETQPPSLANLTINPPGAPPRPSAHGKSSEPPPPPQPPRPVIQRKETETDDDDDDPFGDKNVVETPAFERGEPRW